MFLLLECIAQLWVLNFNFTNKKIKIIFRIFFRIIFKQQRNQQMREKASSDQEW